MPITGPIVSVARRDDAGGPQAEDGQQTQLSVDATGALRTTGGGGGGGAVGPVTPGTGPTELGKAEDSPAASGDVGVMALVVRNDAGTPLAANGDYIPLMVDANGYLYVTSAGGGAVGPVTPGTGATNLGKAEDAVAASGDVGVMALAVRSDAGVALAADGDYIPLMTDSAGRLRVAGSVVVSPVVPGTGPLELGKAEDAPAASGDVGVMALAVRNDAGTPLAADGDYIPIMVDASGRVWIVGSVIANAGTNLNTSALALEAGGNLAAIAASASVLDDWDETNRAAVNPIAGQAGVAGGSGVDSAATLRVSLATNVALPAGNNNIGDVDVASVVPGIGAANLGKAEDAVHASGDVGVQALAVRNDAGTPLAANGDYIPLMVDAAGALYVNATLGAVVPGTGATNLGKAEDAPHSSGDVGVEMLGVRNDTGAALSDSDLDYTPIATDAAGRVRVGGVLPGDIGKARGAVIGGDGDVGAMALFQVDENGVFVGDDGDYAPATVNPYGSLHVTPDVNGGFAVMVGNLVQTTEVIETVYREDFSATGAGTTRSATDGTAKYYSLQVFLNGAVTSWDVRLEVSLDGTNWFTLITHTNVTPGANGVAFNPTAMPVAPALNFRVRVAGLVLGAGTAIATLIMCSK